MDHLPPKGRQLEIVAAVVLLGLGLAAARSDVPLPRSPHQRRQSRLTDVAATLKPKSAPKPSPWLPAYVAPMGDDLRQTRKLYVVNYAHLDTQWRWSFRETIAEFLPETVDLNVEYFKRFPNHVFNFTGASRYQLLKEYYPERYQTVKEWVKRGRWFPAGNQWEECDVLVPSAESLLRQILYGSRFFLREFGTESQEFMLPDSFGFPASLPSLLAHAGLRGFSTQKLTWDSAVGIPFGVGIWRGADGRSVIAALHAGNYGAVHPSPLSQSRAWATHLDDNGEGGGLKVDYLYNGTGDVGGAPHELSMRSVEASVGDSGLVKVVTGPADRMFREIGDAEAASLPEYSGDLLLTEHSAGSLTSQAFIKRQNRTNELLADAAERAAVTAELLGAGPYPATELEQAWQLVLRGQFHDILPGTSIPKAYEYSWNDEFVAMNRFAYALTDAVTAVGRALDTQTDGVPVVVYNALSIPREDLVELELPDELTSAQAITVITPEGEAQATQLVTAPNGERRLLFAAATSAMSFSVYSLRAGAPRAFESPLIADESGRLENGRYRVGVNASGDVATLRDLAANRELLSAPMRHALLTEWPSEFPAWNMSYVDRKQEPRNHVSGPTKLRVLERGPLRVALQVERETEGSRFIDTVRLAHGGAGSRVEFRERIDWKSTECSLKASFPFTIANPEATYSWDLGTVRRGNNRPAQFEVPTHAWMDLTARSGDYGVTVLTGAKYGSDKPTDDTLRLTLLYTPATTYPYREQRTQDLGRHDIAYALVGHTGDLRASDAHWQAQRFEQPLVAFRAEKHQGPLGRRFGLLSLSNDQIAVVALKRAEDGNGYVIRLQELLGRVGRTHLRTAAPIRAAWEMTGVEKRLAPLPVEDGALNLDFSPHQLRTVNLEVESLHASPSPSSLPLELPYDLDAVSSNAHPGDGNADGHGSNYPAEMLPEHIQVGGVTFQLGPSSDGQKNALVASGQSLPLPAGYDRVYVLGASRQGPRSARLRVGNEVFPFNVAAGAGYLGQWDNREFVGAVAKMTASVQNPLARVAPAYLATARVAWAVSHWHRGNVGDDPYAYAYLFSYAFPIPAGARTLRLPKDPRIYIFAVTVAKDDNGDGKALTSLFPDLERDAQFRARFDAPNAQ